MIDKANISEMILLGQGYYSKEGISSYAGIQQRWIAIFSQAAYEKEYKTLSNNFKKGIEKEIKAFD